MVLHIPLLPLRSSTRTSMRQNSRASFPIRDSEYNINTCIHIREKTCNIGLILTLDPCKLC